MAVILLLTGAIDRNVPVAVIDAQRINIREPDGTLRMVLSNAATEPGIIVAGKEQPHPSRRSAGLLFYNDEGTENGGLIFDGKRSPDGRPQSSGSLTFDRYRQDQVVQLAADEDGRNRHAGLIVNDHPDAPLEFPSLDRARSLPASEQASAFRAAHAVTTRRVFIGRTDDGASEMQLRDANGATRLLLRVDAAGAASVVFLNGNGRPVRTFHP